MDRWAIAGGEDGRKRRTAAGGLALLLAGLWLTLTLAAPAAVGWCARLSHNDIVVQSVKNARPEEYTVRGKVAPLPPPLAPAPASPAPGPAPSEPPAAPAAPLSPRLRLRPPRAPSPRPRRPRPQLRRPAGDPTRGQRPGPARARPGGASQAGPASRRQAATALAAIRLDRGGDFPRLTLDLGGPATYNLQRLARPARLVLDVPGRYRLTTPTTIDAGPGGLSQIRAWAHEDYLRVVLDLSDATVKVRITPTDTGLTVQLVQPAAK
jgi:hypothetical protein